MIHLGFETVCKTNNYNKALGSARIRCYDLINYFKGSSSITAELYNGNKQYDIVVFQKLFNDNAVSMVSRLKAEGDTKTVFDIGTNYLECDTECVSSQQIAQCKKMLSVVDCVSVSSPSLKDVYKKVHSSVSFINDAADDRFLDYNKTYVKDISSPINLVYCGYSNKIKEINLIREPLSRLNKLYNIKLLYISDKDPGDLFGIPYKFVNYDQDKLPELLLEGDIKISPRNLDRVYNLGHSALKIAYPMAVGLPVVVSPISAYIPYVQGDYVCHSNEEWFRVLKSLIESSSLRTKIGLENKETVRNHLCLSVTGKQWQKFFEGVV